MVALLFRIELGESVSPPKDFYHPLRSLKWSLSVVAASIEESIAPARKMYGLR
jgi:hypothetical protein